MNKPAEIAAQLANNKLHTFAQLMTAWNHASDSPR